MPNPIPGAFPNIGVLGYYRPYSQTIHISCASQSKVAALETAPLAESHQFVTTLCHEVTHWLDHTSTLCGQEYLALIYNAFHALDPEEQYTEEQFWRGMALRDFDRRHHRHAYYTALGPSDGDFSYGNTWVFEARCGIEFDSAGRQDFERPIYFAAFLDRTTGELIARQPLTVAALWETSAVWSEMTAEREFLVRLPAGEDRVNAFLWNRAHVNHAYSKQWSLYSAPAHLLSIRSDTMDIYLTYEFAAAAVNYCLNLPKHFFRDIIPPQAFRPFGTQRLKAFKKTHDRGYLYAVLSANAPRYEQGMTARSWLDAATAASGLPSADRCVSDTEKAMTTIRRNLMDGSLRSSLEYLLDVGKANFKARHSQSDPGISPSRLADGVYTVPPVIFDDGGIHTASPNNSCPFNENDLEGMVNFGHDLEFLMENFQGACR